MARLGSMFLRIAIERGERKPPAIGDQKADERRMDRDVEGETSLLARLERFWVDQILYKL